MRRLRGVFERMSTFEALWRASRLARRGKRRGRGTATFEHELEGHLLGLQDKLRSGAFRFSGYRTFTVREPAVREIRAAPNRDRVVHHALCAELEPVIEGRLVDDSYACRVGKGTHRALDRLQRFLRGGGWVVKVDVRKYFFSIDHGELLALLRRLYHDARLDALLVQLLATYDAGPEYAFGARGAVVGCDRDARGSDATGPGAVAELARPRGLPIGNLTSQLFANYYLAPVDRFIKERIRARRYLRYMDDLVLVAPDRVTAKGWLRAVCDRLGEARLTPHPDKTQVLPVENGVRFLGFRVYPHRRRILRDNLKRFTRRMRRYAAGVGRGDVALAGVNRSLDAWLGYAGARPDAPPIGREGRRRFLNDVLAPVRFHPPGALGPWAYWVPP